MQAGLSQSLQQKLTLAPVLQQSLEILMKSSVELETYLLECLESNPLLEVVPPAAKPDAKDPADTTSRELADGEGDNRWELMYVSSSRDTDYSFELQQADVPSVPDSLHEQINQQPMADNFRAIAHALVDTLDEDGYCRADLSAMAEDLDVNSHLLTEVLEQVVQELEPAGIGARDLAECLLLQLGDAKGDQIARRLLLHFADDIALPDTVLASKLDCPVQSVTDAKNALKRLDPFPGHSISPMNVYVTPDLIFRADEEDVISVELAGKGLRVKMGEQWKGHAWEGKDKEFMGHAEREAVRLIQAIEEREHSLIRIGHCLAQRQKTFLTSGMLALQPLTMQEVAQELSLHESTVSRAVQGKYAQTPIGLIELKRFFSAGLPVLGGGMISVYRVRQRVKSLIESELPGKPLSDQVIAERLVAEGIDVARRTVAKYREQLGLPSSSQRRHAERMQNQ
ncbi:MAG: RNA polymerase sigma-54 factor [Zetaproteobacteria bacterium CG_4_9_14_3_um_filter_49_83]|nr:MAG: RNA polymerase sigma-54 factor [Zetaproteobacteria bacterium CG1_02_49_23]PIV31451.1 MAG: RNA polymerase sigma-54 factor [Zetaproteobacteria bacterium CG02_land_8_20_14_3_00_50_9]PIY55026.1 MAG: RNA polymerase sigma-54 factor [Zetaproteobacteria bacterium CG_4_10_14_0_8_um_filter_49_80]PJA36536.1 MAG: RNA polymerase sigma-54 factor [Zetaproteobacteria bacterium CG_4_9_14_3_um_filter_49_83]